MEKERCFGCMELTQEDPCSHCGWEAGRNNAAHQLPVGTLLQQRYLLGRVLGQGGFGITYLSWDTQTSRTVCVKEFFPGGTVNRDSTRSTQVQVNTEEQQAHFAASKERFLREFRALAALRDIPEIVDILDFFEENDTAYIVMEYIQGIELKEYVQRRGGRIPMDELLRILKPLMKALPKVHSQGLIHRDISPDNIMLHPVLGSRLLDFGAVRAVETPGVDKELTHSTQAILKNGFAPMEQYVAKGALGPWTDVYALSATIYYCLTGRIPEDAPARMLEDSGFDWEGAAGITPEQKQVLERGMALRTADRIPSVEELMAQLTGTRLLTPEPTPQKPNNKRKKKKPGLKWLLLPGILILAFAVFLLLPVKRVPPVPERPGETMEPETVPPTDAAVEPETEPTEPAPGSLLSETEIRRILAASWGGMVLDDEGRVWLWEPETGQLQDLGITDVVTLSRQGGWDDRVAFLKTDGTVTTVSVMRENESFDVTEEISLQAPGEIAQLMATGPRVFALSRDGVVFLCRPDRMEQVRDLPENGVSLQCYSAPGEDGVEWCYYTLTCADGAVWRWSQSVDGSWTTKPGLLEDPAGTKYFYDIFNESHAEGKVLPTDTGSTLVSGWGVEENLDACRLVETGWSAVYAASGSTMMIYGCHASSASAFSNLQMNQGVSLWGYGSRAWEGEILAISAGGWSAAALIDNGDGTACVCTWGQDSPCGTVAYADGTPFLIRLNS